MTLLKKISVIAFAAALSLSALTLAVTSDCPVTTNVADALSLTEASFEASEDETDVPDTTAAQPATEPSNIKEFTVYEVVRIRRDFIAGGGAYTIKDYKRLVDFIVGRSDESKRYFNVSYDVSDCDASMYKDPEVFEPVKYVHKKKIKLLPTHLLKDGFVHSGWAFNGVNYDGGAAFIVPDCDAVLTPVWTKRCKMTYFAGDYDDIVGNATASVMTSENANYYLATADRFTRPGYAITGWISSYDGEFYYPGGSMKVPSADIVFEAVWEKASYDISMSANNGNSSDRIVLNAKFDEEFVFPECEFVYEGKTFAGWKYNGKIYQPGESFIVPALMPGKRIIIVATWE